MYIISGIFQAEYPLYILPHQSTVANFLCNFPKFSTINVKFNLKLLTQSSFHPIPNTLIPQLSYLINPHTCPTLFTSCLFQDVVLTRCQEEHCLFSRVFQNTNNMTKREVRTDFRLSANLDFEYRSENNQICSLIEFVHSFNWFLKTRNF